jgi:Cu/Ag efflux protein CusF
MRVLDMAIVLTMISCHGQQSNVATSSASGGTSAASEKPEHAAPAQAEERHPVRGVVVSVLVSEQSLLVSHEDIPGVMAAMTMAFKTDAGTLSKAKKGQKISGQIVKHGDEWWLTDFAVLAEP